LIALNKRAVEDVFDSVWNRDSAQIETGGSLCNRLQTLRRERSERHYIGRELLPARNVFEVVKIKHDPLTRTLDGVPFFKRVHEESHSEHIVGLFREVSVVLEGRYLIDGGRRLVNHLLFR